jgi:hypothetical protein
VKIIVDGSLSSWTEEDAGIAPPPILDLASTVSERFSSYHGLLQIIRTTRSPLVHPRRDSQSCGRWIRSSCIFAWTWQVRDVGDFIGSQNQAGQGGPSFRAMFAGVEWIAQVQRFQAGGLRELGIVIGRCTCWTVVPVEGRVLGLERSGERACERRSQWRRDDTLVNGVRGMCVKRLWSLEAAGILQRSVLVYGRVAKVLGRLTLLW